MQSKATETCKNRIYVSKKTVVLPFFKYIESLGVGSSTTVSERNSFAVTSSFSRLGYFPLLGALGVMGLFGGTFGGAAQLFMRVENWVNRRDVRSGSSGRSGIGSGTGKREGGFGVMKRGATGDLFWCELDGNL